VIASPLTTIAAPDTLLRDLEAALVAERQRLEGRSEDRSDVVLIVANIDAHLGPIVAELASRRQHGSEGDR
jgi:hypothetical protein